MKTAINNSFVMSATIDQLKALAVFLGMNDAQIAKAIKRKHLAAVVGTKFANHPEHSAAFAAGTLEVEIPEAPAAEAPKQEAPPKGKRAATKSAKDWLRELLEREGAEYTLAELCALSGKTEVNIRTMLSDLRSPKYAGKKGVFNTKSTRKDQKVYYSKA